MSVIHQTTLSPTKLELLSAWLPSRPWYRGGAGEPELAKAGGFRLDDPQGEVGIEFMVATDTSGAEPTAYLVPLTYRGSPLDAAEHALIGTAQHGVLGHRWVYDGVHDPVLAAQLIALMEGRVEAQAQSTSDTLDREVSHSYVGDSPAAGEITAAASAAAVDDGEGTELPVSAGAALRVCRVLRPAPDNAPVRPADAIGHVDGCWKTPDGTAVRGLFVALRTGARA